LGFRISSEAVTESVVGKFQGRLANKKGETVWNEKGKIDLDKKL